MEHNTNDLEQLLKKQTEGYRMYPSAKVWNNINSNLHGKQRVTLLALFALFLLMGIMYVTTPTSFKNTASDLVYTENNTNQTSETDFFEKNKTPIQTDNLVRKSKTTINESKVVQTLIVNTKIKSAIQKSTANTTLIDNSKNENYTNTSSSLNKTLVEKTEDLVSEKSSTTLNEENNLDQNETVVKENDVVNNDLYASNASSLKIDFNNKIPNLKLPSIEKNKENNSIKIKANARKVVTQYYFTPSISYRNLNDKRDQPNNTSSFYSTYGANNLDHAVYHKPALGVELGVNWLMAMDDRMIFKTGLQINRNRYNIKATQGQPEIATIALTTAGGNQTVNSVTTIRNEGFFPQWMEKSNLQISIPVGLSYILSGSNKTQFGLAGTVQPSYLLKNKMLILSTDLKNYTEAPSLVRRFNVNGGIETFIAVNGKNVRWQFGPQIRYQFFSTYNKKYPFQENLFDYGFKIGISRPF